MRTFRTLTLAAALLAGSGRLAAAAQEQTAWDLDRCIRYALEHSNEIRTRENEVKGAEIQINTAKMSRMPDLSASVGGNAYFGRGPGRDGSYIDNSQLSASFGVSTSMPVYQGLRIRHEIDKAKLDFESATHNLALARENIALNVTSYFLQVLYAEEMLKVAENQLSLSTELLQKATEQYRSGKSSRSEVIQNEAETAADRASLTKSRNDLMLALLDLRMVMNLPDSVALDVEGGYEGIPEQRLLPEVGEIFDAACRTHPSILAARSGLGSSEAALKSAQSQYQPSVYLSAGYGNSLYRNLTDPTMNTSLVHQLSLNGNEYIGLSLSIPIYSRNSIRNSVRISALNVENSSIALDETVKQLRKEIEQAYWGAVAAYETMTANGKSLESARLVLDQEIIRMESGKSNPYAYSEAKTKWENAQAVLTHSKYDYLLKLRILEFYMQ